MCQERKAIGLEGVSKCLTGTIKANYRYCLVWVYVCMRARMGVIHV